MGRDSFRTSSIIPFIFFQISLSLMTSMLFSPIFDRKFPIAFIFFERKTENTRTPMMISRPISRRDSERNSRGNLLIDGRDSERNLPIDGRDSERNLSIDGRNLEKNLTIDGKDSERNWKIGGRDSERNLPIDGRNLEKK